MTTPLLPPLPATTRLSPTTLRLLGANPSKYTLQGSNTYLLGTGPVRLLLDTGEGKPEWSTSLARVLRDEDARVGVVVLSHWHGDHVGGVEQVRSLCGEDVTIYKHRLPTEDEDDGYIDFQDGHVFEVEGVRLRALHTPGHTADHMCFVHEEEKIMFTMDNVLGHGTAVFEDLGAYMSSLHIMEKAWRDEGLGRALPGHGEVVEDGGGKVREYIEHRLGREREVVEVLERKRGGEERGWTSMEIVKVVYKAYPDNLHGPAEGGVRLVLKKLEEEGRVVQGEGGRWRIKEGSKAAL